MTVLDPSALRQLEVDTQSGDFVRKLADTYERMLDVRVERIRDAVVASDVDRAMDAALSLRVSSIMIGATELAELATGVADTLRSNDLLDAGRQARLLPDAAERARTALDRFLHEPVSAQASTDSIR